MNEEVTTIVNKNSEIQDLMVFEKDALEVIENTPLFNDQEKKALASASENMDRAFFHSQVFRTDTEARISVLNDVKFPTPASKWYQSLREMNVHQGELVHLLYDYEDKKQDLKILRAELEELQLIQRTSGPNHTIQNLKNEANVIKKEIEIKKITFSLKTMKRMANGRQREIMQWDQILHELEPIMDKTEIPKDNPDTHQKVSYAVRFIRTTRNTFMSNAQMGTAEANNLLGQLTTNMKVIRDEGLEPAVVMHLSFEEQDFIVQNKLVEIEALPQEIQTNLIELQKQRQIQQLALTDKP